MRDARLFRGKIDPVTASEPRPLWSVMIPTFNSTAYLRVSLASVLAQDPGPAEMQIEVLDDRSVDDDPEPVVAELGKGRVAFFRQERHAGLVPNLETAILRSKGRLVHVLHADDWVKPGFYRALQSGFQAAPEAGSAFCRSDYVAPDREVICQSPLERPESGIVEGWSERLASGQRVTTPSVVVRREVYEAIGAFDRRLSFAGEDWEMWVRAAVHAPVWHETQVLAAYLVKRPGSLTAVSAVSNELSKEMRRATEIIGAYLSDAVGASAATEALLQARDLYASWSLEAAAARWSAGDRLAAAACLLEALRCRCSVRTFRSAARLLSRGAGTSGTHPGQ